MIINLLMLAELNEMRCDDTMINRGQEAEESIAEVRELMIENPDDAAEILMDELGLEMDYLFDILDF